MSRLLRALRSRLLTHLCLAGIAAVVTAALVVAGEFTRHTGLTWGFVAPLVVLAVVAFPTAGSELGTARRAEIGVSRLRGMHGRWYVVDVVAEPVLSLLGGALLGAALGLGLDRLLVARWFEGASSPPWGTAGVSVVAVVLGGLLLLLLGMARGLREPVATQVAEAGRPRRAGPGAVFFSVFVLVAAAVAVYRSRTPATQGADLVVLAGPALVGLGAGQLAVWVARGSARVLVRRRGSLGRSLAWSLACRRVVRSDVLGAPMRLLVASGVVAAVTMGGAAATTDWCRDAGRIAAGAPLVLPYSGSPDDALLATRRADPQGRWLMAGADLLADSRAQSRQAWVDTSRYARVAGDFLARTPAAGASSLIQRRAAELQQPPKAPVATGGRWRITATMGDFDRVGDVHVDVAYSGSGGPTYRTIEVLVPPRSTRSAVLRLPECRSGCRVSSMSVGEGPPCSGSAQYQGLCHRPGFSLDRLDFGGIDLLRQPWHQVASAAGHADGAITFGGRAARVRLTKWGRIDLEVPRADLAVPTVTSRGIAWDPASGPVVRNVGGAALPPRVLGRFPAVPLVSRAGSLADLSQALQQSAPAVPAVRSMVLARADTPARVLRAISGGHADRFLPVATFQDRLYSDAEVVRSRGYAAIAVACLLLGPLSLGLTASRQRRDRHRQSAALRLLRVGRTERRRAWQHELLLESVVSCALVVAGAWCAEHYLLAMLPLLVLPAHQPPVDVSVRWVSVVVAAALVAVVSAVVAGAARRAAGDQTAPSVLREGPA